MSYDAFAAHPAAEMQRLCRFVGVTYRPLDEHVDRRVSHGTKPLEIDPPGGGPAGELLETAARGPAGRRTRGRMTSEAAMRTAEPVRQGSPGAGGGAHAARPRGTRVQRRPTAREELDGAER